MTQFVPLNSARHANKRVRAAIPVERLRDQQMAPLVVHEFVQAGSAYPIVFLKNSESSQFQPVALLAFPQGKNLFIEGDNWVGDYLPGMMQTDPLRLMNAGTEEAQQLIVAVDEDSPLLSDDEGEPLFDGEGKPSPFLEQRRKAVSMYYEHAQITRGFVAELVALELLQVRELAVDSGDQKLNVGGIHLVDEQKLAELEDAKVLDLYRRGFLQAIHAQMMSLQRLRPLAARQQTMS